MKLALRDNSLRTPVLSGELSKTIYSARKRHSHTASFFGPRSRSCVDVVERLATPRPFTYSKESKRQTNQSQQVATDKVNDDFTTTTPWGATTSTKTDWVSTYRKTTGTADEIVGVNDHEWERQEVKTVDGGQSVRYQKGKGQSEQHTTQDDFEQLRKQVFDKDSVELTEASQIRGNHAARGSSDFKYDYTKGDIAAFNGLTEHEEGKDYFVKSGTLENDFFTLDPADPFGVAIGTVTVFGSSGSDPDEQGKRKKHSHGSRQRVHEWLRAVQSQRHAKLRLDAPRDVTRQFGQLQQPERLCERLR